MFNQIQSFVPPPFFGFRPAFNQQQSPSFNNNSFEGFQASPEMLEEEAEMNSLRMFNPYQSEIQSLLSGIEGTHGQPQQSAYAEPRESTYGQPQQTASAPQSYSAPSSYSPTPAAAPASPAPVSTPAGSSTVTSPGQINNTTDFAKSLLSDLGDPTSQANVQSVVTWENREGGNWNNSAHYNPLNTTESEAGATSMNGEGVKAYTSWQQGLQATVSTLKNGDYNDILSALQSGNGLGNGSYKGLSTWSGGGYTSV